MPNGQIHAGGGGGYPKNSLGITFHNLRKGLISMELDIFVPKVSH